jgi:hydrogenase nickel incorporation protein HypB
MCDICGCGDPRIAPLDGQDDILAGNRRRAQHNRAHLRAHGVFTVNLMGSPGAGKTAVLEATASRVGPFARCGALAGDLATDRDALRLTRAGVPALSITTGSACHLDANMVHDALHALAPLPALDYLFIENVGNLVCPARYDLGQDLNVVALSVTEGEDKPLKYPAMFATADLVLLTKIDLLPQLQFDVDVVLAAIERVMPANDVIFFSAVTGEGVDRWLDWLAAERYAARIGQRVHAPEEQPCHHDAHQYHYAQQHHA